eukprot:NODE_469_length_8093_cov_0.306230.p3 type:complete len:332 gc:universal NODE_469_length_8093_cov_0.306230:4544-3549(-)
MVSFLVYFIFGAVKDCQKVSNLAKELGMDISYPNTYTQIRKDCCTADGVTCNTFSVTSIIWRGDLPLKYGNLNGSINSTALPEFLVTFDLNYNKIIGKIPDLFPTTLEYIYLQENRLNGTISDNLPTNLKVLWVEGNLLSGNVVNLPTSLFELVIGYSEQSYGNHFTGPISLNKPRKLYITDNGITSLAVTDSSRLTYDNCDISNNPLKNSPSIANLAMCKQLGLYFGSVSSSNKISSSSRRKSFSTSSKQSLFSYKISDVGTKLITNESFHIPSNQLTRQYASVIDFVLVLVRCIIDSALLFCTVRYTPYKREWKTRVSSKNSSNGLIQV